MMTETLTAQLIAIQQAFPARNTDWNFSFLLLILCKNGLLKQPYGQWLSLLFSGWAGVRYIKGRF